MTNVIIMREETKRHESYVLQSFGVRGKGTPEQREAAAVIAARSREIAGAKKGGKRKMAAKKIKVEEKTPGKHIAYEAQKNKLVFGDDELSVNLASRERDYEVTLDICIDTEDGIVIGTGGKAQKYAAQIVIPARRYDIIEDGVDENGEPREVPMPIEFDMSICTLILWGMEE